MSANPLNRIVLRRLALDARIGHYAWEQQAPQPIVVEHRDTGGGAHMVMRWQEVGGNEKQEIIPAEVPP